MDAGRMAKAPNRLTARVEIPAACGGRTPNKVKGAQCRISLAPPLKRRADRRFLRLTECDHAKFAPVLASHMRNNQVNHTLGFALVCSSATSIIHAILDVLEAHAHLIARSDGWERDEPPAIEFLIGEVDQGLVFTAIVPEERLLWQGVALLEDAIHTRRLLLRLILVIFLIGKRFREETRGWKLLIVANDDQALATRDCADRVLRRHLRRLIENHQIKRLHMLGRRAELPPLVPLQNRA